MGRGRKPTPSWLKVVDGNPGKRPIKEVKVVKKTKAQDVTPRLKPGQPEPVKVIWRKLLKQAPMGVLTGADSNMLNNYCHLVWQLELFHARFALTPAVFVKGDNGKAEINPLPKQIREITAACEKLESLMGFNPVSRVRLGAEQAALPSDEEESDYF